MTRADRRRRRTLVRVAATAAVVLALGAGGLLAWSEIDAQRRLDEARGISAAEREILDDTRAEGVELATRVESQQGAFRAAADIWEQSEAAVAQWRADVATPTVEVSNPGGDELPGGDAPARALLDAIGAGEVQLVFDAGPQNCGYHPAPPGSLTLGGCYNSRYRSTLFLAWDEGVGRDTIWPLFVHEAMHWYQWEHYFALFQAGERVGVTRDAYLAALESDASCRAVHVHAVPAAAYDASSAPCDVEGWHESWFVEQLAALGVPTGPPDPEGYEVEAVARP